MDQRSQLIVSTYCRHRPAREGPLSFHKWVTMRIVYALPDTSVCVCLIDFPRNTYTSTSSPMLSRVPLDGGNGSTIYPSRDGHTRLQGSPLSNQTTKVWRNAPCRDAAAQNSSTTAQTPMLLIVRDESNVEPPKASGAHRRVHCCREGVSRHSFTSCLVTGCVRGDSIVEAFKFT